MAEFAVVSVGLTETTAADREIFDISVLYQTTNGKRHRYRRSLRTTSPIATHARLLRGDDGSDESRDPAVVAAELTRALKELPVIVCGGSAAAQTVASFLGSSVAVFDLSEIFELFHTGIASDDPRRLAGALEVEDTTGAPGDGGEGLAAAAYLRLLQEASALDSEVLYEIVQRTAKSDWPLRQFFAAAAELAAAVEESGTAPASTPSPRIRGALQEHRAGKIRSDGVVEALAEAIAESAGGYESRPEQLEMAAAVHTALTQPQHLLVEAGTGTGKSLAYLFPAACYALRTDSRVLISTNTINLQEQLLAKDIPGVRELLAAFGPPDVRERAAELRCTVLKGRRNYLCLQRFAAFRRNADLSVTELRFLTRVLIWLARDGGDRSGMTLPAAEEPLWNRVCAEGTRCFMSGSPYVRDGSCQLAQARRKAETAHIVVVNHALLLSDAAAERHVLPAFDRLIVDEAHNLEDQATDQFGFHAGQAEIANQLDAVHSRARDHETGLVADVRTAVGFGQNALEAGYVLGLLVRLGDDVERARQRLPETFAVVRRFVEQHGTADSGYERKLLISSGTRAQPDWPQVEVAWDNLDLTLSQVEIALEHLAIAVGEREEYAMLDKESVIGAVVGAQIQIRTLRDGIGTILGRHDATQVAWLTLSQGGIAGVSSAPLNVGEVLDASLFSNKGSVVLTSATLTAAASFEYVRGRLGVADADELALGSPFDYKRAALVLLPSDMPDPNSRDYQPAVVDSLMRLCTASRGRALVLFTSHSALQATYRALRGRLAGAGVRALAQGIDGTPADLIAALRADAATAILGTSSFWEGVDVVGEALSLLVIAKLPFSVPSDPVFAARAELFDDPFRGYSLPQAVLRFKQGFGRLIRHRGDRGVAVVLDRRIRGKGYGRVFLDSLPACTVRDAPIARLGEEVASWLELPPPASTPASRRRTSRVQG